MVDFKVLRAYGSSSEHWGELFVSNHKPKDGATDDEKDCCERKAKAKSDLTQMLVDRAAAGALRSLSTAHVIQSCDIAYRGNMLTGAIVPLLLYAQGRIGDEECVKQLSSAGCDQFIIQEGDDKSGNRTRSVNTGKFTELSVGLVRSVVNRRRDAQANLFRSLRPLFRYQPRGGSEADALIADLLTQRVDIMSDQFGYRAMHDDWALSMALYPYSLVVPAQAWQRDVQLFTMVNDGIPATVRRDGDVVTGIYERVSRSGVPLMSPHPSRVFWDPTFPLKTINTDTGVEFFGHWDVVPRRVLSNPDFFNTEGDGSDGIASGPAWMTRISDNPTYFTSYYPFIGAISAARPLKGETDRPLSAAGLDEPMWVTHMYCKLKPAEWGVGEYPHAVWVHFTLADESRVISVEVMPTCPGAVLAHNSSEHHSIWMSMANELMGSEDQLTKLISTMLALVEQDAEGILAVNTDMFASPEQKESLASFVAALKGRNFQSATNILKYSGAAMKALFGSPDPRGLITRVSANTSDAIAKNLNAQAAVIASAERLVGMSSLEAGQPIAKTASASESNAVFTTSSVTATHMTDDIDDFREALKGIFRAHIACHDAETFKLPVAGKYSDQIFKDLRLDVVKDLSGKVESVSGFRWLFIDDVQFTSQDGSDRPATQAEYAALTQLLQVVSNPQVAQLVGPNGIVQLLNRVFKSAGPNIDLVASMQQGAAIAATPEAQPTAF